MRCSRELAKRVGERGPDSVPIPTNGRSLNRVRVFLADDQPAILKTVARVLEPPFGIVRVVSEGVTALKATERSKTGCTDS